MRRHSSTALILAATLTASTLCQSTAQANISKQPALNLADASELLSYPFDLSASAIPSAQDQEEAPKNTPETPVNLNTTFDIVPPAVINACLKRYQKEYGGARASKESYTVHGDYVCYNTKEHCSVSFPGDGANNYAEIWLNRRERTLTITIGLSERFRVKPSQDFAGIEDVLPSQPVAAFLKKSPQMVQTYFDGKVSLSFFKGLDTFVDACRSTAPGARPKSPNGNKPPISRAAP